MALHYFQIDMKHFINLSSCVINKLHIIEILKKPNKYYIYMNYHTVNGFSLFSVGSISTAHNVIEICEKNNKQDYDIITNWIDLSSDNVFFN
jgi:hypothetical protein